MGRLAADMRAFGYSAEAVEAFVASHAAPEDDGLLVHPENLTAVRLADALRSQWRWLTISSMAGARVVRTGLDYGVIAPTAALMGLEPTADDFLRLRSLESLCMSAWNREARG